MHSVAFAIAKYLNFDVARRGEVFFDIDFVIAKGRLPLGAGGAKGRRHFLSGIGHFHPASTTAGGRFDDDGIAKFFTDFQGRIQIGNAALRAWHAGHTKGAHRVFRADFIAHNADMLSGWANKIDVMILQSLHEGRVFRKEAIARVNGICTGDFCGCDDGRNAQIAFRA